MRAALLLALVGAAAAVGTWTDICKSGTSPTCPTIMMGVSCQDESLCAIVGGYGNTAESVYYSKDQFATFTKAQMDADSFMLLDIGLDASGNGATAGLGLGSKSSGLLYTTDVTEWSNSSDANFVTGQSMSSVGNSGEFAFVGAISTIGNQQGVLTSVDGGKDWVAAPWPAAVSAYTEARYGAFPSANVWYVTGGSWPSSSKFQHGPTCYSLTQKTCVEVGPKYADAIMRIRDRRLADNGSYTALMSKTSDGGATWEVQYNMTGQFYFNDIGCADENTCYAVAEGFSDGSAPGARVFATKNGGTSWTQQLFDQREQASLMRVHVVSATEAWAAGGYVNAADSTPYGSFFHTVDGGATWTQEGNVKYVGDVPGLHFASSKLGFATAITEFQTSTMIQYTN